MIVQEPPYDLVALFSDLEMQKLFEVLIERGQASGRGCTQGFRWRSLRDPRRDTVWLQPERPLAPFLSSDCRFLVVWDRHGSGAEEGSSAVMEQRVVSQLEKAGIEAGRVLAISLDPELECLFHPVWPKVKSVVAKEREESPPDDTLILSEAKRAFPHLRLPEDFGDAVASHPKEMFEALVHLIRLRRSAPLYAQIGTQISLPAVKQQPAASRLAVQISHWFPPQSDP